MRRDMGVGGADSQPRTRLHVRIPCFAAIYREIREIVPANTVPKPLSPQFSARASGNSVLRRTGKFFTKNRNEILAEQRSDRRIGENC
ncbi:MAG: hypothetical protein ACJ8FS_16805 [Sphingomicrobium sp.]